MSRNKERKTERYNGGNRSRYIALAGGILLAALISCGGMFFWLSGILTRYQLRNIEERAAQDRIWVQSATVELEEAVTDWVNLIRNREWFELKDILDAAALGSQMLDSRQLFLVDDDFFYYGSNGLIMQIPEYNDYLKSMKSDCIMVLHDASGSKPCLLVCVKCKPFSADDETFLYALAEFSPETLLSSLVAEGHDEELSRCVLDGSGKPVVQTGETPLLSQLEEAKIDAYSSMDALKDGIGAQDHLCVTCTLAGSHQVLISDKIGNQGWVLLSLSPLDGNARLPKEIMVVFGGLAGLMAAAVAGLVLLLLRLGAQRERAITAQANCQAIQAALESAQETNRSQAAFLKRISHDIRTPLSSIDGYTALAGRHIREPDTLQGYLEKITEASAQLLAQVERGLGKPVEPQKAEPAVDEQQVELTGRRVLLVEDNELNREITAAVLSEAGMEVVLAEDGQAGFQRVALSTPGYFDLVLMDLEMPVMDGCEATKTIRRLRNKMLAEIPILAMTASVSDEDKKKAFQAGMNGYVEKPMDIDKLLAAIRIALQAQLPGSFEK